MEKVDVLIPPTFKKSGITKNLKQAWHDEEWIGAFNLWILQRKPVPTIVYQIRSAKSIWAPNKLDVTAGGYYSAGEKMVDGLREVEEELGKKYEFKDLTYIGRKIHVGPDINNYMRKNIVDISFILDNFPLGTYKLEKAEVYAICACPIEELLKVHIKKDYNFTVEIIDNVGNRKIKIVTKNSFPYNWDDYHYKIALFAQRFLQGEKDLIY